MNRYVLHICFSSFVLLFSIGALLYGLWDAEQPRTGPEGDGDHTPTFRQLLPVYLGILMGVMNLPVAIVRFVKYKKAEMKDNPED